MRQRAFGFFSGPFGLSDELITDAGDRNFSAGQGNWIVSAGNDVTWDGTDMDFNCNEWNAVKLTVTVLEGAIHRFEYEITASTSGALRYYLGGDSFSSISVSVGTHIYYQQGENDAGGNFLRFGSSGFIGSIDNVSLKRVL